MDRKTKIATVCALLGCSIFGFSFMFSRIALGIASPFVMLTYRFLFAFIGLTVLAIWSAVTGRGREENAADIDFMRFDLRGRKLMPLVLLGLVQPVIYFFCESYGISMTNATFSGVIISLVPIAGLIFGALFLREMPTRVQVRYSLLSIAGVVLMTVQQSAEGEIRPLRLRLENETRELQRVDIEEIVDIKQVPYVGVEAYVFLCRARLGSRCRLLELKYSIRSHTWWITRYLC